MDGLEHSVGGFLCNAEAGRIMDVQELESPVVQLGRKVPSKQRCSW